ncbi:MAG TPA: DNA repair protein RecN [Geminicoccus sp.]|jgi:DNA repair protein RecN (Recombination protein N)|uniref:DNA repair protein RecN n=1 Tax=Geminicoccus sp. TaxID=2024832 RepID=UPI002E30645D|nr:DNA repair protein RecN [Geminicoccus sp.]HEX2527044.1 DNA repair protein RecN [Geminicoccus sp.]
MLQSLNVRDLLLLDRLDLEFGEGLTTLTGETGAGKSILLDCLGLATGARAERGQVRIGTTQGSVTALFTLPPDHPARPFLAEQGIACGEEISLRRVVFADGRSRGFIEDEPVAIGTLERVGRDLAEVHGQFEQRGLADPTRHRALLDAFGGHEAEAEAVRRAWQAWRDMRTRLDERKRAADQAAADEERLRAHLAELEKFGAVPGEEEELAKERQRLQTRDRQIALFDEAAKGLADAAERLANTQRKLDRSGVDDPSLEQIVDGLERASSELADVERATAERLRELIHAEGRLDEVEERLFALRALARKHRVSADQLEGLQDEFVAALAQIETGAADIVRLEAETKALHERFLDTVKALSAARERAAQTLGAAVAAELAPLKLERATLRVTLTPLEPEAYGQEGAERVAFEVRTNPGQPFGPIGKIASGGELARFMLALKVVLARLQPVGTLVFDEIDAGTGGATADAIGERLARLAADRQVLVVTHAPQVAARAQSHLRVVKVQEEDRTRVTVERLEGEERRDEVARMLAGAQITAAARAAADSLLQDAVG